MVSEPIAAFLWRVRKIEHWIGKSLIDVRAILAYCVADAGHAVSAERAAQIASLKTELRGLNGDIAKWNAEVSSLAKQKAKSNDSQFVAKLADYQDRIGNAERRMTESECERHLPHHPRQ